MKPRRHYRVLRCIISPFLRATAVVGETNRNGPRSLYFDFNADKFGPRHVSPEFRELSIGKSPYQLEGCIARKRIWASLSGMSSNITYTVHGAACSFFFSRVSRLSRNFPPRPFPSSPFGKCSCRCSFSRSGSSRDRQRDLPSRVVSESTVDEDYEDVIRSWLIIQLIRNYFVPSSLRLELRCLP